MDTVGGTTRYRGPISSYRITGMDAAAEQFEVSAITAMKQQGDQWHIKLIFDGNIFKKIRL